MQSRTIQPSPIVKNRKIPAPGKETKPTNLTKGEAFHKKFSQSTVAAEKSRAPSAQLTTPSILSIKCTKPSVDTKVSDKPVPQQKLTLPPASRPISTAAEKLQPPSVISKAPSTLSTNSKKTVSTKVSNLPKRPSKQSTLAVRSRLEVSLSRGDLKQLVTKFGEVSTSVLQIATSRRPVGARSLEALLNLEISKSLGDAVNDPVFSQAFVQATRRLLEELVRLYEGGKLNPKLLRERERGDRSFIRANSATTVCYRDRYFKELVMNILQSMTSSEIEEEVAGKAVHSEESSERIRIIRDMVRSEAGLEPEDFRELERRLEELRRSLSRNKLEMEKAASEVDKIISQHIVKQEQSTSSLQIPKSAREVWRGCCKRLESGSDGGERDACKSENGCCEQMSCSRTLAEDGSEKYKKSLDIVGDKECFEKGNSDEVQNIRPKLKHLVHEELLRIKMKEEEIFNRDREFDRINRLGDTPKSSFESVEFKSAASNFSADDDDEINEEETRTFLEALKAEIEENKITDEDILKCGPQGVCIRVLEKIDEAEDEINYRETAEKNGSSTSSQRKHSSCSLSVSSVDLEPHEYCKKNMIGAKQHNTDSLEKQPSEKSLIEGVKSQWFYQEVSDIKNVLAEMKDAFETVKVISDVFSAFKVNEDYKKETGDADEATKSNADSDFHLWDFTVGEVANVLINISVKVNSLPEYLKEIESENTAEERKEAFQIMSVLDKCMNASNPINNDVTVALGEASMPIEKFAKTFSFLSNTLSCSTRDMKSESISVFNPPKSLIDTLYTLSSTSYFRDCFTSVKDSLGKKKETTKYIEVVKPYNINENTSSGDMLNFNLDNNKSLQDESSGSRKKIYSYTRDKRSPDDLNKNLGKFEHFMGLTASVMTIQNVSDMFLFLSTVLNDVPERLKSEKILDLDPPLSLLKALDILYCEEDIDSVTDLEKKKSFASLTIQNVSDFLLTLSKTFEDVPDRLKESIVTDLRPPQSLLRAITLLTSLSHFSIPESCSKEIEDVHEENLSIDNNETFFDAVASMGSMR